MKHSSLFVLPSLYEGFPIVLSEAAALGLPVVGSEKAIPKEIFSDEKSWERYTYKNIILDNDYSLEFHKDDYDLFKIVKDFMLDNKESDNWRFSTKEWSNNNNKINQFESYLDLINESRHSF